MSPELALGFIPLINFEFLVLNFKLLNDFYTLIQNYKFIIHNCFSYRPLRSSRGGREGFFDLISEREIKRQHKGKTER